MDAIIETVHPEPSCPEGEPSQAQSSDTSIDLKDFLSEFGDILKERIARDMKPLFDPFRYDARDKERAERLNGLQRQLKPGQVPAVLALAKGYLEGEKRGLILCAEMGCGKTIMALAVAYLLGAKRVLVQCPGHLVRKWIRETEETIPGVKCFNINGRGLDELMALRHGMPVAPTELWETEPVRNRMEVWVLGKERAKLHYQRENAYATMMVKRLSDGCFCPKCGKDLTSYFEDLPKSTKPFCPGRIKVGKNQTRECREPLYQPGYKFRRFAKAEYIKRYLRGAFDFFIADELHQLKGGVTGQGQAFADLATACDRTLALTGTLMGGYSTNMYYLLWRLMPREMKNQALAFGQEMSFASRYGILERTYSTEDSYNKIAIGGFKGKLVRTAERPGISPLLLTDFLLPYTCFMRLADVADSLPPYSEKITMIPMQERQRSEYQDFEETLIAAVKEALKRGDRRLLGKMINSLLAYPDGCTTRGETITLPFGDEELVIATAPLIADIELPKVDELLNILKWEIQDNRKVLLCLEHTGTRDLVPGLVDAIEKAGMKSPLVLRQNTVSSEKREDWLRQKSKEVDFDVLITNPRLIETGLDLIDYSTIVYYQTGYSIFTLRQSSRRSWRIGQERPVRVYYTAYEETAQAKALKLIASKLETALAVEGDLSDKGLAALANSESSMLFALARELVGGSDGISVQEAWEGYTRAQMSTDSFITDYREPVSAFIRVLRGMVKPEVRKLGRGKTKVVGNGFFDKKHQLIFQDGKIYWVDREVGWYRGPEGEIRGKKIQLIKHKQEEIYYLVELRLQEVPTA